MLGVEITSIPSILPTLERVLPADFRQLQWIMNAYTIAMCAVLIAMGALGDRFGRKRIFILGIIIFAITSFMCGIAQNAPLLIAARFIQGVSAAAMLATQLAILSSQFRDKTKRSIAFGWWGTIFGAGLGFGPIIGGGIISLASWEWVFLIHVFISAITLYCAQKGIEESFNPKTTRFDFAGIITLSIAVFGIVYLITQGQPLEEASIFTFSILFTSVMSFILFLLIEMNISQPMFDFSVFRVRKFSGSLLGSIGMNFSFWPFIIYFPIYLQTVLGYDTITTGLIVLAYTLPTIILPTFAEKLLLRRGPGFIIPLGLLTISAGFILLTIAIAGNNPRWFTLLPGCILAGIGLGLTHTPVSNTATAALPAEKAGMASGMDMSARMISLAINIALMGVILLSGVSAYIIQNFPQITSDTSLNILSEAISAGNLTAAHTYQVPAVIAQLALAHGISWITLYAAFSAAIMSALSFVIFGKTHNNNTQLDCHGSTTRT